MADTNMLLNNILKCLEDQAKVHEQRYEAQSKFNNKVTQDLQKVIDLMSAASLAATPARPGQLGVRLANNELTLSPPSPVAPGQQGVGLANNELTLSPPSPVARSIIAAELSSIPPREQRNIRRSLRPFESDAIPFALTSDSEDPDRADMSDCSSQYSKDSDFELSESETEGPLRDSDSEVTDTADIAEDGNEFIQFNHPDGARGSRIVKVAISSGYGNIERKVVQLDEETLYCGLFEGEGGETDLPKFCAHYLDKVIAKAWRPEEDAGKEKEEEEKEEEEKEEVEKEEEEEAEEDLEKLHSAIKAGFLLTDAKAQDKECWNSIHDSAGLQQEIHVAGSSACVVVIKNNHLIVANAGACQCVISRNGVEFLLSVIHVPATTPELNRMVAAYGDTCTAADRLEIKALPCSRAIGFIDLKMLKKVPIITAIPALRQVDLKEDIEFVVIGSKQFWSSVTSQFAIAYINHHIKAGKQLSVVCSSLYGMGMIKEPEKVRVIIIQLRTPRDGNPINAPPPAESRLLKNRRIGEYAEKNWENLQKTHVLCTNGEQSEVLEALRVVYLKSLAHDCPYFKLPRHSAKYCEYDHNLKQISLKKQGFYKARGIARCNFLSEAVLVVDKQVRRKEYETLRGGYYVAEHIFPQQPKFNTAVREIGLMCGLTRSSLYFRGMARGSIAGQIMLSFADSEYDCMMGLSNGMKVPMEVEAQGGITKVTPNGNIRIRYVLIVEKEEFFSVLAANKFHVDNQCILLTGKGMPSLGTRLVASFLEKELKVPIFCLVDPNPYGSRIYKVYKFGSYEMASELGLTVPSAELVGVFLQDITKVKQSRKMNLTQEDEICLERLIEEPCVQSDKVLYDHLLYIKHVKYKMEIDTLKVSLKTSSLIKLIKHKIDMKLLQ